MKYIMMVSVLILFFSCSRYYQSINRLNFSLSKSEKYLERIETANFYCEQILKMKNSPMNYSALENTKVDMNEFEKYRLEMNNAINKMGYLNLHNMTLLEKWIISRDKLTGELFLGSSGISERAEYEELYINSQKMKSNYEESYELPLADQYNIEYNKYSYDHCNRKIDTFSISRVIDLNLKENLRKLSIY